MNRADSLNQYLTDVNSGVDTVVAWRSHKARVGELAAYEATLASKERQIERRKSERIAAGCVA